MTTFDWSWLNTQVGNFLNRGDLYQSIPTFIGLAEATMIRRLAEKGVTGAVTRATANISAEFEVTPTDYAGPIAMTIYDPTSAKWLAMENVTLSGMAILKSDREAAAAIPLRYAVVDGSFQFSPTPDQAYDVDLAYYAALTPLSATATTNWVITNHPDAYLYGALIHAAPMIGAVGSREEPGALPIWQSMFETAMREIVDAERRKRGSMFTPAFRASEAPPNYGRRRWAFNINTGL